MLRPMVVFVRGGWPPTNTIGAQLRISWNRLRTKQACRHDSSASCYNKCKNKKLSCRKQIACQLCIYITLWPSNVG